MIRPPRHIAIIMDGNGRWAQSQKHSRIWGHVRGAAKIKPIVRKCDSLRVEALTLYAFSSENWARPKSEVSSLMKLLKKYLRKETPEMLKDNVRFRVIGDRTTWPSDVMEEVEKTERILKNNTGFQLNFAFSYGSQQEITWAVRKITSDIQSGKIKETDINEKLIEKNLWTDGLPPLDLMIRTGGEKRISNYLLWQAAYCELVFVDTPWPEFGNKELESAINEFHSRLRRYGKTSEQITTEVNL